MRKRSFCCWPPSGLRGVGFSRVNLFGKHFVDYTQEAQSPFLVAMIEHVNAVDNLDDILQVEGLDALLIGPYDLSASMNLTAQFESQQFVQTIQKIRMLANHHGVPCGVHVVMPEVDTLKKRIAEGYRFIAYSLDAVFLTNFAISPCT